MTALIGIVFGFLVFILGLLPEFTGPDTEEWRAWAAQLGSDLAVIGQWIDLPLLATLIGLFVSLLIVYGAVRAVLWVASHIPAIGTRGGD
ncbi:MAG: hypothetical protein LC722_04795 [Actinobacteria bacterium]|nr:hypothetical protein [Actinomycetota bacterium]